VTSRRTAYWDWGCQHDDDDDIGFLIFESFEQNKNQMRTNGHSEQVTKQPEHSNSSTYIQQCLK
jgi:hypothetical protein